MAIRKCEICGREQSAEISERCCECRFPIYVSDKDPKIRAWHYREASERGYKNAQYNLGMCYEAGIGIPKDYVEAARWFRKAAEQGHPTAQYKLGEYYRYGIVKFTSGKLKGISMQIKDEIDGSIYLLQNTKKILHHLGYLLQFYFLNF